MRSIKFDDLNRAPATRPSARAGSPPSGTGLRARPAASASDPAAPPRAAAGASSLPVPVAPTVK
jgi:hypothetical protein